MNVDDERCYNKTAIRPPKYFSPGRDFSASGDCANTDSYLSFMSFRVGEETYRIKFTAPCT
jgi:hypothetical protein